MLHYFTQLPKDYDLIFEKNIAVSKAIMHTAQNAFTPFYQYLDTTIKALDKKEDIKATWTKVKENNLIELKIIGSLYEVPKTTKIKLLNIEKGIYSIEGDYEKDFDIPLILWNNKQKIKINLIEQNFISENRIKLNNIYEEIEKANWAGDDLVIKPTWITVNKTDKIFQNGKQFNIKSANNNVIEIEGILNNSKILVNNKQVDFKIIEISKQPQNTKLIKEEKNRFIVYSENKTKGHNFKLQNLLNKENINFEDGAKFNAENTENLTFITKDKSIIGKTVICDNVKFEIKELRNNDKNQYWIQLHEIDEEKEDIPGFSPLKYFFDDDISIKDDKGNEYTVAQGIESEYKLVLREKNNNKKYNNFAFPKGKELQVRVNTYQLRKQLEAVLTLQNMPVAEHSNLIKLFEKLEDKYGKKVVNWHKPTNEYINEWVVLTDENRSGSYEQREFVEKAISTPDFAILEGPPGSGKTTVILELICQLAKKGKRVLLCGSTHVAIDNVLERLKEKDNNQSNLIEKFNILPVRIGDENRINEDIKEFQIDNLQKEYNISENLLLDVTNLVCGTTIGILQHPKFKSRRSYNRKYPTFDEPIVPEFDYLIIDESSKTTFQEFLVPGLYAKKWILAGDVMQLSPFTDREQIVTNLETLPLKKGPLPKEYQIATFYLHKLLEITKYAKNKFILPVSNSVIEAFGMELMERNKEKIIRQFDERNYNRLELTASDIIIIDKNILDKYIDILPETHATLRSESWQTSQHAFTHNNWQQKGNSFKLKVRNNEFENSFEIVDNTNIYFKEKSWAEEIAWRIDREHQLRLLDDNKKPNYKKTIEELIPLSLDKEDIEEKINNLASIAFPSILESLIKGIKGRKTKNKTTISEGFTPKELESRRTVLKYQHRMHPEISKFPREQFYKNDNALLDLEKPKPIAEMRQWDYIKYAKRSIWINVNGKTVRNYNENEANILISELGKFIDFASKNEQPEGKEWTIACLTFYKGQEAKIRERLQKLTGKESAFSNFNIERNGKKINIKLHTVDKFQGHEADIVFLSMVQTFRDGFMDNPNRLNVAITRAKFQLVIIGDYNYFAQKSRSEDLKQLALNTQIHK
jgi:DNA polymerase III delta prime subunit